MCKRLRNYVTCNFEHIFTTVKTEKNFLRGDNLKICKRSAFGGRKRGKNAEYDWRARDNLVITMQ